LKADQMQSTTYRQGVPQIEVTFDVDADCILSVNAKDLATGKEKKVTIVAPGTALSGRHESFTTAEAMINKGGEEARLGSDH